MNCNEKNGRRAYLKPAFREKMISQEKNFLASGTGENMDPTTGLWDDEND